MYETTTARRVTALILSGLLLLSALPGIVLAGEGIDKRDTTDKGGILEEDLTTRAAVTTAELTCRVCGETGMFTLQHTPEDTADGVSAESRGVGYSDGTLVSGEGTGDVGAVKPRDGGQFTWHHWRRTICQSCGAINGDREDYGQGRPVFCLEACPEKDRSIFPGETVSYAPEDGQTHLKIVTEGMSCAYCYGYALGTVTESRAHQLSQSSQPEEGRFAVTQSCAVCGYEETGYASARVTVTGYEGVADGRAHTVTVEPALQDMVEMVILFGDSPETCLSDVPPAFQEPGTYTVWYAVTYTCLNASMEERGSVEVVLREPEKPDPEQPGQGEDPGPSSGGHNGGGTVQPGGSGYSGAYIYGFPDGTFRPEEPLTRAQAAAIFARLVADSRKETIPAAKETGFSDVRPGAWYADAVAYLAKTGVLRGREEGIFAPEAILSRAELVAAVNRLLKQRTEAFWKAPELARTFSDVPPGHWAYREILAAANTIKG